MVQQENIAEQQHRELTTALNGIMAELAKLSGNTPAIAVPLAPVVNVGFDLSAIVTELKNLNSLLRLLIEVVAKQNSIPPLPIVSSVSTPEARKKILGLF